MLIPPPEFKRSEQNVHLCHLPLKQRFIRLKAEIVDQTLLMFSRVLIHLVQSKLICIKIGFSPGLILNAD